MESTAPWAGERADLGNAWQTVNAGMDVPVGAEEIAAVNTLLLDWFAVHGRQLAFRSERTPYRVWVSEVMLQQTQAQTAGPRLEAFWARFPDVRLLAAADEQEVLAAWQGLGYYARARNLHAAARTMVARHGGRLPEDPAALRALPGVGPYIAAAIGAFAFGRDEAACDANVRRVLARLWNHTRADPALAQRMVPPGRAAAWNDAMMDLGALVCRPRRPNCGHCPLRPVCRGHAAGRAADLPRRPQRRERPVAAVCLLAIRDGEGRWAVVQRPARGLLAGMWECPSGDASDGSPGVSQRFGLTVEALEPLPAFRHVFTHRVWEVQPFVATGTGVSPGLRWIGPPDLWTLPLAGPSLRVLRQLAGAPRPPAN